MCHNGGMIPLAIALAGVGLLIFLGEYLRHVHLLQAEVTRKFIHITVAAFAATWPFFMEWNQIQLMSLLMFVGIMASRTAHLFRAIHGVKRRTWGELFFAMGIGTAAVLCDREWAFVAAMLIMGVADGFAALVGTLLDNVKQYKVFGHMKSKQGTATFFVMAIIILVACNLLGAMQLGPLKILIVALIATGLENLSVAGTDNLFVPLAVVLLLN